MTKKQDGSITIYLCITMAIILSLIFCIIESARITSLKVRAKAITYTSLESAFAHFALPLYEKYGIFGVFTTEDDFLSMINNYAQKNANPENISSMSSFSLTRLNTADIKYTDIYHLTDMDGLIFANQAVAFEKYRAIPARLKELSSLEKGSSETAVSSPADMSGIDVTVTDNDIKVFDADTASSDSPYGDLSKTDAEKLKGNVISKVTELIKSNLLLLFVDNQYNISDTELDENVVRMLPTSVCVLSEAAAASDDVSVSDTDGKSILSSAVDKALFLSYIDNSFSSYTDFNNETSHAADISLKYQKEYILCGKSSDDDNLLSAALSIVSLRAAFNMTFLLKDSKRRSAAFSLGNTICGGAPIASRIAAFAILSAWAYAEGIIDTRDLFCGKKVPLIKPESSWTLSLPEIVFLGKNTPSKNSGNTGLTYGNYLDICLFSQNPFLQYYRTMDLIQLDICENYNPRFLISACITGADISIGYASEPLFTKIIQLASPKIYSFTVDMLYGYD